MLARETPDAAATSSTVVLAIPRRAMHSYAPSSTRRRTSFTRTARRSRAAHVVHEQVPGSEIQEGVESHGEAGSVAHRLDRQHHAGHERRAVVGVVTDRERLTDRAEQHL